MKEIKNIFYALVGATIVGVLLYSGINHFLSIERAKQKQEWENEVKLQREADLRLCITRAQIDYEALWDRECEAKGLWKDCSLPKYNADRADESREEDIDNCLRIYK